MPRVAPPLNNEADRPLVSLRIFPGARHGSKGYFIQPTAFADVTMEHRIAKEEIFGPVASIIKFKDEEEAISIANNSEYGLAGAVHSESESQEHASFSDNKLTRNCSLATLLQTSLRSSESFVVSRLVP